MAGNSTTVWRWALFCWLVWAGVFVHQRCSKAPTALSRLDLLQALVRDGTLCIDKYEHNTPDKAAINGHHYSDKAPGTAVLALPWFAAATAVLAVAGVSLDSDTGWLATSWVATVGANALPGALGGVALFAWLRRRVAPRVAFGTVAALLLGAAPLPYSTMLFSHALVVGCIGIAVWALHLGNGPIAERSQPGAGETARHGQEPVRGWRWDALAGLACGWALASEYTAGLVVVGLIGFLLWGQWRRMAVVGLGAVPPLLLIPAYSWACLGTPFALPYSYQASFPEMKEGLYAIGWPDAETAFRLLFGPTRGLFFWSPFLLLAWVGYWKLAGRDQRLFWLCYAVPVLQIVVISGRVWDWPAGPTLGPRYLAPMLPLLALPCAYGLERFPRCGTALAVISIGLTTLATLTDACPPGSMYHPLLELHVPRFLKGELSSNLGLVLGLSPYASVALYYAVLAGGIAWLWCRLPSDLDKSGAPVASRAPLL